jgi:NAD(P)H-hydrate epimerase
VEDAAAALTADQLAAELAGADWIVDALFGTGLQGPVRPPFDGVIRAVNAAGRRVFAVDLPSGLDADTGQATDPTVRAAATATFVALKPGFLSPGADRVTGAVRVVGIGAPGLLLRGLAAPNDA